MQQPTVDVKLASPATRIVTGVFALFLAKPKWNPPTALKLLKRRMPSGGRANVMLPEVHGPEQPVVPGGYVAGSLASNAVRPGVFAQPQMSSTCWAITSALPD